MDFLFNSEQRELKEKVIALCEERLKPLEKDVGETNVMSREIAGVLAESGLFKTVCSQGIRQHNGYAFPDGRLCGSRGNGPSLPQFRIDFRHAGPGELSYCLFR